MTVCETIISESRSCYYSPATTISDSMMQFLLCFQLVLLAAAAQNYSSSLQTRVPRGCD